MAEYVARVEHDVAAAIAVADAVAGADLDHGHDHDAAQLACLCGRTFTRRQPLGLHITRSNAEAEAAWDAAFSAELRRLREAARA